MMSMLRMIRHGLLLACVLAAALVAGSSGCNQSSTPALLNVSYDPTRELYQEYDKAFVKHWKETTGQKIEVESSHGGSGKQARTVLDGKEASVVTLALAYDIDALAAKDLLPADWQKRLPNHSCPYTSTIVFLVRKGNPKNIKDWDDLVRSDVSIITPHPKSSGGARWNYLAAWGYVLQRELGDLKKLHDPKEADAVKKAQEKAKEFVAKLFKNVRVLDSGARAATLTFVQREQGDVLLAWENEAFLSLKGKEAEKVDMVVPSVSIEAEPAVALVDKVADKLGTRKVAEAYLTYLYSPEGQAIVAKNFYRPSNDKGVPAEDLNRFAKVKLFKVDDVFGGWNAAHKEHFSDGGVFDQIYRPKAEEKK